MEVRVRVPQVPAGLGANLIGLAGLVAVAVAVGGLTGTWWWSVLAGGVFAVALAWVAQTQQLPVRDVAAAAAPSPADAARAAEAERARDAAYMRGQPVAAG